MPLLGKIVVIKRNGTDGTEFPLTASCLFGRKLDCDIRIQLPQVSKEHCRIELNENKELILTNLSSVNPTRINGEVLQQTERLKHGDLITIIDRSFRFEYPPTPTPKKKRLSTPGKGSAVKVLQHQQVQGTPGTAEKKKADHSATCLKDGSNLPPMDQSIGDVQSKANTDGTSSPFSDLCNMVKRDLATKPWKSSTFQNTPVSKPSAPKEEPKKASMCNNENDKSATPKSAKKRSSSGGSGEAVKTPAEVKISTPDTVKQKRCSGTVGTAASQKTPRATPQKFTAQEAAQQIIFESPSGKGTPKSPKSRRDSASVAPATPENQETPQKTDAGSKETEKLATRSSPRSSAGKRFQVEVVSANESDVEDKDRVASKKHKSNDLPLPAPKRKRVSFGGQLSPELFDKRLPPDSPLRRGATPGRRSLGFFQRPQSLLRRASTIGLMGIQLHEDVSDMSNNASPKRVSSQKTPSPKTVLTSKTPSPAKKSPKTAPTPKTKTSPRAPSPKNSKTPSPSSRPATPQTPKSTKRVSSGPADTACSSDVSLLQTPKVRGRFSVSRISTPSPVSDQDREATVPAAEEPRNCATPNSLARRRSGVRVSAKSALNSVARSRRSGASMANLKVLSSWADIVKFGQAKSQAEGGVKKTATKQKTAKQPKVEKLKTPARKLKDHTSTGHADSPATIVVGKAYLRAARHVGAAPKVVCNVALLKKDMKMDEDLTGVADIFKTPATVKRGTRKRGESPETPLAAGALAEMSGMNTPEESGEMVVSPLTVASTAKRGRFNAEAVSRLLHDDQDGSLIEKDDPSEMDQTVSCVSFSALETQSEEGIEKESKPLTQTPKRKPEPAECLTGVKNLMRTPKQRASPVEDLRGRLLRTPKAPKQPQEESLEGVKELLKTPKQKATPVEDLSGIKEMMKTPKVKSSPVVCSVALRRLVKTPKEQTEQEEDLTGVKELMKTPKINGTPVDDLFGVERLIKTPKQKHEPVEDLTGIKEMMKTPKQKSQLEEDLSELKEIKTPKQKSVPVEDLTGIKEMKTTPKQKLAPVEDLSGIKEMMKTPKVKSSPVVCSVALRRLVKTPKDKTEQEEDLTGVKELMKTPKIKGTPVDDSFGVKRLMKTPKQKHEPVEDLTGVKEMMKTPKQKLAPVEDLTGIKEMKTPKQKHEPVEDLRELKEMKTPKQKSVPVEDLTGIKEMMKTPKQKSKPVEDLTGIKEMMKTPKQKRKPVEDLTGLKEMMKTPKQKSQPVEDDFEISTLMKTPKQSLGVVVESTRLVELVSEPTVETEAKSETTASPETQSHLAASTETAEEKTQVSDESEDKENICPGDMDDEPTTPQADSEPEIVEHVVEEPVVAAVVASVPSSAPVRGRRGKVIELVEAVQSPARQSTRGRTVPARVESPMKSLPAPTRAKRGRNADQESGSSAVPALEEPESSQLQASEQNGAPEPPVDESADVPKAVIETNDQVEASAEAPVKSSARSRRGKVTKKTKQDEETNVSTPVTEQTEIRSEAVADETEVPVKPSSKTRRGRAEKKEMANVAQANGSDAVSSQEESVPETETEVPLKSSTRARRGRCTKKEAEDTESTSVIKETGAKSAEAVSDEAETEAPVKSDARTKRGRVTKKETPKTVQIEEAPEPTPVIESSVENPDVESAETTSNTRSRRGRTTKTEPKKIETADVNESSVKSTEAVAHVDPEAPVKSNTQSKRGRTTKAEPPKNEVADVKESDTKSSEAGIEADGLESTELESSAETEVPVKSNTRSRRGRTAKTTKQQEEPIEQAPANEASANEISDSVVEMPVVKPGRGRRAKQVEEPPVVRSGRGAKSKPQVLEDEPSSAATEAEEPVLKPAVRGGRRTKQPDVQERVEDKSENDADAVQQTGAPATKAVRGKRAAVVRDEAETLVKRGRRVPAAEKPSRGRKAAPEPESEETVSATAGESESESQSAPDLSASSEPAVKKGRGRHGNKAKISAISEAEESRIEHEPEAKVSKKVNWRSDLVTLKNVEDLKPEPDESSVNEASAEPPSRDRRGRAAKKQEPEKSKPSAEEAVAPARRGRAAAASEPRKDETSTKSEQKRKVAEVVTESLPKRRRGKADSEEAAEVEPENDKPARGRRKGAQEPSAAPTQAEETDVSARRGTRSQKKTEPAVSAPVKRSRRK